MPGISINVEWINICVVFNDLWIPVIVSQVNFDLHSGPALECLLGNIIHILQIKRHETKFFV